MSATRALMGALGEARKQHGTLARYGTGAHFANGDELNKNEAPGLASLPAWDRTGSECRAVRRGPDANCAILPESAGRGSVRAGQGVF
ncbi:MAG: hypothetical protein PPHEMADM_0809 [uncultured Paraburkholderia sp.]|nr:MAG: hypothetical protein PPHEESC_0315 [uncultured Paraburkholderia sp.]CAH2892599.1 MAG: hypothetical protein PPHEMADE_0937 [uncultured Paraburkholderia sp.]CAH2910194.1 MAG: hypothetical protein PPHEMADMSA_0473 [uncultured Paraburkholderia sp.]CAH2911473.1 MAG: hypothetical protein PPHEMADM_0809 [uncultured Paraburkholderia sp.]CAH2938857.1 MAG: hypothetical protein PPHERAN_4838 [uncultured Paraburkholderia sp.]